MPEVLTVAEAAAYLRVEPQTVYKLLRSGRLAGVKAGKEWRIHQSVLEDFVQGNGHVTQDPYPPAAPAWLEAGLVDAADRLQALENDLSAGERRAWWEAVARVAKPARYVPGRGLVLEERE